jgi:hypothetical protein
MVQQGDGLEFLHVFQTLADEDIPGLPPGGGLSAKYVLNSLGSVTFNILPYMYG